MSSHGNTTNRKTQTFGAVYQTKTVNSQIFIFFLYPAALVSVPVERATNRSSGKGTAVMVRYLCFF